jgi:hypothetical protein
MHKDASATFPYNPIEEQKLGSIERIFEYQYRDKFLLLQLYLRFDQLPQPEFLGGLQATVGCKERRLFQ